MNISTGTLSEQRRKEVAAAVADSVNLKKYCNIFLHGKSKQYIVTFLQHAIVELKEIHDQYYR